MLVIEALNNKLFIETSDFIKKRCKLKLVQFAPNRNQADDTQVSNSEFIKVVKLKKNHFYLPKQ